MVISGKIREEKIKYDINIKSEKISTLLSSKMDK